MEKWEDIKFFIQTYPNRSKGTRTCELAQLYDHLVFSYLRLIFKDYNRCSEFNLFIYFWRKK